MTHIHLSFCQSCTVVYIYSYILYIYIIFICISIYNTYMCNRKSYTGSRRHLFHTLNWLTYAEEFSQEFHLSLNNFWRSLQQRDRIRSPATHLLWQYFNLPCQVFWQLGAWVEVVLCGLERLCVCVCLVGGVGVHEGKSW